MLKKVLIVGASLALFSANASAQQNTDYSPQPCAIPANIVAKVQDQLKTVIQSGNGGLFKPNKMWSAIVDRKGVLCSAINTIGDNPGNDPWPGSRSIAIAKASTANDFSNDQLALSTANLYGVTQPGGSLYGLNNSNPFNPRFQPQGAGIGFVPGGIITFGGGVADGGKTDNIIYSSCPANASNNPTCVAGLANTFQHPHCTANDITAANPVRVVNLSFTQVQFTGTGSDMISYSCIGN